MPVKRMKAWLLFSVSFGVLVAEQTIASHALAQTDEIVVTARFREETIQDIGASVSAIDGQALAREGIVDLEDIARRTAGVSLIDRGPNQNDISIRGVANGVTAALADQGSAGPLVSQFLDDVPVSANTAAQRDFNYFDFDRVEILRGPQPTLFGEGSVGGTIRYITKTPDLSGGPINDSIIRSSASFTKDGGANYSVSGATSVVLAPDVLGVRGVFNYRDEAGYIDNPTLALSDINDYEAISGRAVVLFQPTSDLAFRLMGFFGRDDLGETNSIDPLRDPDLLEFSSPIDGAAEDDFNLYTGRIEYRLKNMTITSITGWYERKRSDNAYHAQAAAGFGFLLPVQLSALGVSASNDESFTQEIRVVSDFEGPLNFTGGFFYQDATFDTRLLVNAPELAAFSVSGTQTLLIDQGNTVKSEQYSGFAEFTYDVAERFRVIGGARYVSENIVNLSTSSQVASGTGGSAISPPFVIADVNNLAVSLFSLPLQETFMLHKILPRFAAELDIADAHMLYAIASSGVRNGNLNPFTSAFQGSAGNITVFESLRSFDEDSVWSFELGAKTSWLDGDLIANISTFYTLYSDPQILTSNPLVLTVNGPDQRIIGIEMESYWKASDILDFYLTGVYQSAEFTDNAVLGNATTLSGLGFAFDLQEGSRPVGVPEWALSLGGNLNYPLPNTKISLVGHGAYQLIGSRYATNQNFPSSKLGEQHFLNFRLGMEGERWSLIAFVTNALNELQFQSLAGNNAFVHLDAAGDLDFTPSAAAVNRPRTIGAELTIRY